MMSLDFSGAFYGLLVTGLAIGAVVVGLIWGGVAFFTEDDIRVREPLVPRIELVVEDNVVDTVFVYERP